MPIKPRTLSEHNKELDASLQDQNARKCVKDLLTRRKYSKEKKEALLPDKRKEKLTIGKRVEYCAKAAKAGVDPEIINNYARDPALIQQSNKIQKER
ncbi:hypothetical protein RhiirB3_451711 [Rhizophagus irregularis]|nr:hypothetical protein RhiirB3_451711 [Rhizophagus irregularis]